MSNGNHVVPRYREGHGVQVCALCGKTIADTPLVRVQVQIGPTRSTSVWVCLEEFLGARALSMPQILAHMQMDRKQSERDIEFRNKTRANMHKSRFGPGNGVDALMAAKESAQIAKAASHDDVHGFKPEGSRDASTLKGNASQFVEAKQISKRLGVTREATIELVKQLSITPVKHNGIDCITMEDYQRMDIEVRKLTIASRRETKAEKYKDQLAMEAVSNKRTVVEAASSNMPVPVEENTHVFDDAGDDLSDMQ